MAAQDLRVALRLTADASGLKAEVTGAAGALKQLGADAGQAGGTAARGLDGSTGAAARLRTAFQGLASDTSALRASLAGLAAAFSVRDVAQTTIAYDRLQRALQASAGDAGAARQEMEFVRRQADLLGLRVTDLAGSWSQFLGAVRGTPLQGQAARNVFIGVASAAAAMGLSAEDARSALLALSQMAGKGTVQAEELRGQLGERMPAAIRLLAASMGVTIEQLNEMMEKGQLTAQVVLPRLAQALQNEYGAAALRASNDAEAAFNRAMNAFDQLKVAIGRSGLMDGLAAGADALRETFADPQMQAGARAFGEGLGGAIRLMVQNAGTIIQVAAALRGAAMGARAGTAVGGPWGGAIGGAAGGVAGYAGAGMALDALSGSALVQRLERLLASQEEALAQVADDTARAAMQAGIDGLRADLTRAREAAAGRASGAPDPTSTPGAGANPDFDPNLPMPPVPPPARGRGEGGRSRADEDRQRMMGEGARLAEQLRTPYEAMNAQLERYSALLNAGAIDQEVFNRAVQAMDQAGREPFERLMASLDPARAALRDYEAQQETIRAAMERGVITEEEFAEAVRRSSEALGERLRRAQEDADGTTEAQRRLQDGARSLGLTFSSAFEDAILEGKKLGDVLKALEKDIARIILRKAITEPVGGAIADGIGSIFRRGGGGGGGGGSSIFSTIGSWIMSIFAHTGGVVGADSLVAKQMPAALFNGARRYHTGGVIAPDEVPAILKKGEGVFTPEQMRRLAPVDAGPPMVAAGGGAVVNISITVPTAPGAADTGDGRRQLAETIAVVVRGELARALPGIVEASKTSIRQDVRRKGVDRAFE